MDPDNVLPSIEGSDDLSILPPVVDQSTLQGGDRLEGGTDPNIHPSPPRLNRFERLAPLSNSPSPPVPNNNSISYSQSPLPANISSLAIPAPEPGQGHEIMDLHSSNPPARISEPKETQPRMDLDVGDAVIKTEPQSPPHHSISERQRTREYSSSPQYRPTPEIQPSPEFRRETAGGPPSTAVLGMIQAQQAQLRMLEDQDEDLMNRQPRDSIERQNMAVDVALRTMATATAAATATAGEDDCPSDVRWMEEDPEEDNELQELTHKRNMYEAKAKSGKITHAENADLYRVQTRISLLKRIQSVHQSRLEAPETDDEGGLFVSDISHEQILEQHRNLRPMDPLVDGTLSGDEAMADDFILGGPGSIKEDIFNLLKQDIDEDVPLSTSPPPVTKPRKKRAKNAREVIEQEQAEREKARNKAQRKKGRKGLAADTQSISKAKSKGVKKGVKKSGKGSKKDPNQARRMANGRSGHDDITAQIIHGLANADDISARINDPIYQHEMGPTIVGKLTKQDQFKQLFANIPEEDGDKNVIRNDKKKIRMAALSFGYANVKAQDGRWKIKGMRSLLYHYQLVGAQWMLQRELAGVNPHGGLLADSMGLGKTVQTLACMVGNRPSDLDIKRNIVATLIVLPAAVIKQWEKEIKHHTEPGVFRKVIIYSRAGKLTPEVLASVDIVLTSFTEVMKQFPFPTGAAERAACNANGFKEWASGKEFGVLHQVNWYRVILDEAHAIKNNNSRTSLACQHLKSVYRWCLTGTPLLNTVEELFPYLRFLKANYCMDIREFRKYFCNPQDPACSSRVGQLLNCSMLRRTMKSTMLNLPIIKLPKPHSHVESISFSDEERIIYRITENRFRAILNMYIRRGDTRRNYTTWMVQLLRLRQCTGHPFMMERTIKEVWGLDDVRELKQQLAALGSRASLPFYRRTKQWVEDSQAKKANRQYAQTNSGFGKGAFGSSFSLATALGTLKEKELFARLRCGICEDVPTQPVQIDTCGEVFCNACLENHIEECQGDDGIMTCPSCALIFQNIEAREGYEDFGDESSDKEFETPARSIQGSQKRRQKNRVPENSKGRDALGFEMYTPFSTWLTQSDTDPTFPLTSSAKITALKALLLKGFREAPMDKVVIYCQFRQLQRIIGRMCNQEKWPFVYYTGEITMEHRTKVEEEFKINPDIMIMIAGLKCGGLGLNLTAANRVISMDLWWNFGVEQQAFGRIFRIGQEKETHMTRIVVKNSVDMRMLSRQDQKLKDLRTAIDDDQYSMKRKKLTIQQLSSLFGFLRTDENGELLGVEEDYNDDDEESGALEVISSGNGDGVAAGGEGAGAGAGYSGGGVEDDGFDREDLSDVD